MRYAVILALLVISASCLAADDDRELVIAAWQAMISRYESELAAGKPVAGLLERAKLGIFAGLPNFPGPNGDLFLEPGMHGLLPRMKCIQKVDDNNYLVMYAGPMATQTFWLHGKAVPGMAAGEYFMLPKKVLVGGMKTFATETGKSISARQLIIIDDPKAIIRTHIAGRPR